MPSTPFYRFGRFIYTFRLPIIVLWIIMVVCCVPFIPNLMTPFQSTGFVDEHSQSAKADRYLDDNLGYRYNRFILIYNSKQLLATQPEYINKLKKSLAGLKDYPIRHEIIFPDMDKKQISKDKHTAYVVILFKGKTNMDHASLNTFKSFIKTPPHMTIKWGGEPFFLDEVNKQTQKDLYHADVIAAPVATIILIMIFGSIVAAILPVLLGGGCALIILTMLYTIGHLCSLSIFTINIALLLGICLSLDYSLFIISRFREELNQKKTPAEAVATTLATAGKAVFFSGVAVFISLGALLLFPVNILFSVGVGGLTAVFAAVVVAIIVLPAVLGVLNTRINLLPVFKACQSDQASRWRSLASAVVRRPLFFFFSILTLLLLLGTPFLKARLGVSDLHILPPLSESRQFFDTYKEKFNEHELTSVQLIITAKQGNILSSKHIGQLYDFAHTLQQNKLITQVNSIVTSAHKLGCVDNSSSEGLRPATCSRDPEILLNTQHDCTETDRSGSREQVAGRRDLNCQHALEKNDLKKTQYQTLYHSSAGLTDPNIHVLLKTTTGKQFTVMSIVSDHGANSPEMKTLIGQLRHMNPGTGLSLQVTGTPVNNADVLKGIAGIFPYALTWIIVLTYFVLLLLLRSLFLPLKAILMNVLSLCATYGVLVFVFQEGHLHELLNFGPQGILDISLLVIIFCALFGFSMDYEVFLLTRIQEAYEKSGQNDESIIFGIEHSSRIITSAAIIVIVTCGSFMVADVLMVKEFGLGVAVAIFVDAFLVRSIFVPATMALVKQWNWYLPKWLNKILPKP